MDNKITKKRLGNFLAYEWIAIIIVCLVAIFVWEFAYTVGAVRLTTGQQYKFYYDQNISTVGAGRLFNLLNKDGVLSYDVLELESENLTGDYNVLSVRLSVQEGDIIITDTKAPAEDAEDKSIRAKTIIDGMYGSSYTKLLGEAKTYLSDNFLSDTVKTADVKTNLELATDYANLDGEKIANHFRKRMRKDNRYRKEEQILSGIELEKTRIENLCKEVKDFEKLLKAGLENPDLFFRYTKYQQAFDSLPEDKTKDRENYQKLLDNEKNKGRENDIYGLNVVALKDSNPNEGEAKINPSEYFKMTGETTAKDVVILVFDFCAHQYDLHYESISVINAIVRSCSDILD